MNHPSPIRAKPHLWTSIAGKLEHELEPALGLDLPGVKYAVEMMHSKDMKLVRRIGDYALGVSLDRIVVGLEDQRQRRIAGSVIARDPILRTQPSEQVLSGKVTSNAPLQAFRPAILTALTEMTGGEQTLADVALALEEPAMTRESERERLKRVAERVLKRDTLGNELGTIVAAGSLNMLTSAAKHTGNTAPWNDDQKLELFNSAIDLASQQPERRSLVGLMQVDDTLPPERHKQLSAILDVTWQGLYIGRAET